MIIVLSGPICAGKSSVARKLSQSLGAQLISAREVLKELAADEEATRGQLQSLGALLENQTSGAWLADAVRQRSRKADPPFVVIDAVRTHKQIASVREGFDEVFHCHVTASSQVRRARFKGKMSDLPEDVPFEEASLNPIEAAVDDLSEAADLVLDSGRASTWELVSRILDALRGHRLDER